MIETLAVHKIPRWLP